MAQDYPQDAATEAFEALRAEVTQLRAGVESLSAKFQDQDPTDYAPTLGAIAMSLKRSRGTLPCKLVPKPMRSNSGRRPNLQRSSGRPTWKPP